MKQSNLKVSETPRIKKLLAKHMACSANRFESQDTRCDQNETRNQNPNFEIR